MSYYKDGGPAFPSPNMAGQTGLTIRDYFAAKAMMPMTSMPANLWQTIRWLLGMEYIVSRCNPDVVAKTAYQQADAMLAAREAKQ